MATKNTDPKSYEAAMDELAELIESIEKGDLSLDATLAAYGRGATLLKFCRARLAVAQDKATALDADAQGAADAV
jgi:exodeoxyribonuclease VII small subunit